MFLCELALGSLLKALYFCCSFAIKTMEIMRGQKGVYMLTREDKLKEIESEIKRYKYFRRMLNNSYIRAKKIYNDFSSADEMNDIFSIVSTYEFISNLETILNK